MEPNNTCVKCRCIDGPCFNKKTTELLALDPLELLSVDPLNLEYVDVEIPILNPKINVNMDEELESLENLIEEEKRVPDLDKVMTDIENTANFNSIEESVNALYNPDIIFTKLQTAFNTFKELTGRQMTYSEMREMMG
jgi:hypothetical protein